MTVTRRGFILGFLTCLVLVRRPSDSDLETSSALFPGLDSDVSVNCVPGVMIARNRPVSSRLYRDPGDLTATAD